MTTRRTFLQTLGAGAAIGLTGCGGGGGSSSGGNGGSGTPPTPLPANPILVVVQIQGGNDWLNTLVPTSGANATAYAANRPTLAVPGSNLTDLGSGLGLTKDLLGFDALHAAGRVAWIPGIGMPNPNLSHFSATDFWSQGGVLNATGWLGRWADSAFSGTDQLRGIALTSDLMMMVHGATRDFVSITSAGGYVFPSYLRSGSTVPDGNLLKTGYLASLNAALGDPSAGAAATSGKLWYDAQSTFSTLIQSRTPSVSYPGDATYSVSGLSSQLSNQLKLVAQMIASNIPGQVYTVRMGGFDTHSNQATDHPRLMKGLGGAIKAFYDDLGTITTGGVKAQDRVLVMGWSEFGRRIKENNGGTDHGTASLSFVVGNSVRGGFYGSGYPNLAAPDSNGNMVHTTDYRSLYATLLEKWLGSASAPLLGASYPLLGFL